MTKIIDLSMEVHGDMMVFPRVPRPVIAMVEDWEQFATKIGAAKYGTTWLTASSVVVTGDHVGTHIDSLRHLRNDAPGPEGIPLEYCYGDGVLLDFSDKPFGYGITVDDLKSPRRNHEVTVPRQIAMYLAREMMGLSLTKIGDAFGGRHYTTVMSSIDKVEDSIKQSPSLVSLLDDIRRMIKNPT